MGVCARVCAHKFAKLLTRGGRGRQKSSGERKRFKTGEVVKLNGQTSEQRPNRVRCSTQSGVNTLLGLIKDHTHTHTDWKVAFCND